jgi:hypothetical protein
MLKLDFLFFLASPRKGPGMPFPVVSGIIRKQASVIPLGGNRRSGCLASLAFDRNIVLPNLFVVEILALTCADRPYLLA